MYTDWQYNHSAIPLFLLPLLIPVAFLPFPFTYLETLLGVIGSRPPWPQVTRKLTSPFSTPPHPHPIPNSWSPLGFPQQPRATRTTSRSRLPGSRTRKHLGSVCTHVVVCLSLLNHQAGRGFTYSGVSIAALDPLSSAFLAELTCLENIFSRLLQYANIYSFCTHFASRYGVMRMDNFPFSFSFPFLFAFPPFFTICCFLSFPSHSFPLITYADFSTLEGGGSIYIPFW